MMIDLGRAGPRQRGGERRIFFPRRSRDESVLPARRDYSLGPLRFFRMRRSTAYPPVSPPRDSGFLPEPRLIPDHLQAPRVASPSSRGACRRQSRARR